MINIDSIDFYNFFVAVKYDISKTHLEMINPYSQKYFKINNTYLALSWRNKDLVAEFAITIGRQHFPEHWFAVLINQARLQGNEKLIFHTSTTNLLVQNLASNYNAKKIDVLKDFYDVNDDMITYEIVL